MLGDTVSVFELWACESVAEVEEATGAAACSVIEDDDDDDGGVNLEDVSSAEEVTG